MKKIFFVYISVLFSTSNSIYFTDINKEDRNRYTPLLRAIFHAYDGRYRKHNVTAVKLIRDGAELNQRRYGNYTPLAMAYFFGNKRIVEELLRAGACPCIKKQYSDALAVDLSSYQQLLQGNFREEKMPSEKQSAPVSSSRLNSKNRNIIKAGEEGKIMLTDLKNGNRHLAVARLKRGADPNVKNKLGETCLILAAQNNDPKLVELLIEHGAIPDLADNSGNTPSMIAAKAGHSEALRILLDNGADPFKKNNKGKRAVQLAKRAGDHSELYRLTYERNSETTKIRYQAALDFFKKPWEK